MATVQAFQCDECNGLYTTPELLKKCEDKHHAFKVQKTLKFQLVEAHEQVKYLVRRIKEVCPEHEYKPTGKSERIRDCGDSLYDSNEMECVHCNCVYWT